MKVAEFRVAILTAIIVLAGIISFHSGMSLLKESFIISSSGSIRYGPDTGTLVVKTYYNGTEISGITVTLTHPNGSVLSVTTPYTLTSAEVGTYIASATYQSEQRSDSVYVGVGETKYIQLSWGSLPPPPSIPKYGVGFWVFEEPTEYNDQIKAVFQDLATAGEIWIRIDWVNPPSPFGPFDLISWKDDMLQMGHKPLAILDAMTMGEQPFTLQDWIDEVTTAVNSAPDIPAWEIWNEPNLAMYQLGYMDGTPQRYMDMLIAAYNIIKSVNPDALVIGPALSSPEYTFWLESVISLGLLDYVDAVSVHSYRQFGHGTLASAMNVFNEIVQGRKPIWVTETGYSTVAPTYTEDEQRLVLEEDFSPSGTAAQLADVLFWHLILDANFGGFEGSLGIVRTDYTPKSAYYSFKSLL